jgi:hypothetical protein
MEGLGAAPLQRRLFATTAMPNGQHFEPIADNPVVEPIPDSLHMEATDARAARLRHDGTDSGLLQQEVERLLKLLAYRAWCGRSVGCPPLDDSFNLTRGSAGDMKLK